MIIWRELAVPLVIVTRLPDVLGEPWPTFVCGDVGLVACLVVVGLATVVA